VTDELTALGEQADRIDSLVAGLVMPLPAQFHLDQLREILPDISNRIKRLVVQTSGEDPWGQP
jgi:hypothetical protein